MGQEISQQQQQHHNQNHNLNLNLNHNHNLNPKRGQPILRSYNKDPIYTPASQLSSSCSSQSTQEDYEANFRLRHKYNLSKQTYERTKINVNQHRSSLDSDSHYAKLNNGKYLQRSSSQSSDSGIYNSSCHCSSLSSLSAVSCTSTSSSSGCPSSLLSSKSSRCSLDKQKHYLSHHLYIKSYLDILEEDERARAHFKSARPGGIRNYTPKILGGGSESTSSTLSVSAPTNSFGYPANSNQTCSSKQRSSVACSTSSGANGRGGSTEDPWI